MGGEDDYGEKMSKVSSGERKPAGGKKVEKLLPVQASPTRAKL